VSPATDSRRPGGALMARSIPTAGRAVLGPACHDPAGRPSRSRPARAHRARTQHPACKRTREGSRPLTGQPAPHAASPDRRHGSGCARAPTAAPTESCTPAGRPSRPCHPPLILLSSSCHPPVVALLSSPSSHPPDRPITGRRPPPATTQPPATL
jgi:hypothetical protein